MPPKKPTRRDSIKRHSDVENISVFGSKVRLGPGFLFLYADDFLAAALSLPQANVPFLPCRYYLACHSIELFLKAFLSLKGVSWETLAASPFRHELTQILIEAEARNLTQMVPLESEHIAAIRQAEKYYDEKVFEYPSVHEAVVAYPHLPDIERLLRASTLLATALREPCRAA